MLPGELQGPRSSCSPGEHPFPTQYAIERDEMRIEPSIYLDALMNDFLNWGGKVVIRKFATPRDVATLNENVIINCTGLGAKEIFKDPELMPLKGQLIVMMPQSEINYSTSGVGAAVAARVRIRAHDAALGWHRPGRHLDTRQLVARRRGERTSARGRTCTSSSSTRCGPNAALDAVASGSGIF